MLVWRLLSLPSVSTIVYCSSFVSCTATIIRCSLGHVLLTLLFCLLIHELWDLQQFASHSLWETVCEKWELQHLGSIMNDNCFFSAKLLCSLRVGSPGFLKLGSQARLSELAFIFSIWKLAEWRQGCYPIVSVVSIAPRGNSVIISVLYTKLV